MKPKGSMYQAVTQVNDVSPAIFNVIEADVLHIYGKQNYLHCNRQDVNSSIGVLDDGMIQDGAYVNLGDLHYSVFNLLHQYVGTSLRGQGLTNDNAEVGLGGSTQSEIRTRTWGSAQQLQEFLNFRPYNSPRFAV